MDAINAAQAAQAALGAAQAFREAQRLHPGQRARVGGDLPPGAAEACDLAEDIRGEGHRHAPDDRGGTETRQQVSQKLVSGSRVGVLW